MNNHDKGVTAAGFAGGNFFNLAVLVTETDLLKTAVLAFVGAVVSYLATLLLKRITGRRKNRKG